MVDDELSAVASIVGGSGGKPGRCFASVAGPQADDTRAPAIALGTTRSTINALRTPKDREQAAYTTAKRTAAFTLVELIVSMGVLVLLVLLFTQLLNSAATITILGNKRMDADSQARQLLDRMAIDFAQMVKRLDVDYYLKSASPSTGTPTDCTTCTTQAGNDQIAFFAATPGYYPTPSYQSPISLVAYRVNSGSNKIERMGKGLIWNGGSSSYKPILFLDSNTPPNNTISNQWPAAVNPTATDSDCNNTGCYEAIGPQVFRFEYYYLLKGQVVNGTTYTPVFSDTPWDMRINTCCPSSIPSSLCCHTNVSAMRDVAAIIADIALIDPKSKVLLTDSQIATLGGQLADYTSGMVPGQLSANWRTTIDTSGLPPLVISGIRVYERYFYLNQ